ncbi:(3S,6E)-nerolidol synthase 1-like [Pyrus x bretschneideri]|uniref:(3S,6E)-nerolidol synthase 1-like n=1 Tax=Pyrus x bretschneideri TaxID=225117 RepID=UPI00202FEC86|nr:(3S,6E)-nerolidol synthase 1-like [Pyrus x bretschneideri]
MAHFLQAHPISSNEQLTGDLQVRYAEKLKELKDALANIGEDEQLIAVDAVQRLGVDYHFQEEIEAIMKTQCTRAYNDECSDELRVVSLRFRLLRQQGYHVTTDVFNKFKNNEKFKVDINGLVELYEASHMSFQGEEALVEEGRRSHQLLTAWMHNNLDDHRASAVAYSLEHPYHKSLTRFMAKNFLLSFEGKENWVNDLKELGKLEFNMVESLIRNEIQQVSKWWKALGLTEELKFVRDQPIKWYTWPMACLADPNLSEERVELTKSISLVYIIDDIFDVHGTLDELILFTAAVERWDIDATGELPNYMKICFKALYDITNETSHTVHKKHGWNPIESLKKSWATLCKAFLLEARWFSCGHLPNTEEYLNNGFISSGVPVVLTHGFFLLGQGITKETVHILDNLNISSLISSTATILRLWDDFGSAKDEGQDGYDGSYIKCYVNENQGCSDEDARAFVVHRISEEWKFLNQECFSAANPFSASFTKLALNVARMVPLMYDYNSQHRLPSLEENMKSLLYDSFLAQGQVTSAAISQA